MPHLSARSAGSVHHLVRHRSRTGPESVLAEKHPDWLIAPLPPRSWRVVDFGRPEVQQYFSQLLNHYIRELDIRYIRWDQNLEQLPYWQSRDPKTGEGFVQGFRIRSSEGGGKLVMKALDGNSVYRFTDVYTGESFTTRGAGLVSDGLEWKLPPMTSRLLTYRREP
jgi:hypothetical protein